MNHSTSLVKVLQAAANERVLVSIVTVNEIKAQSNIRPTTIIGNISAEEGLLRTEAMGIQLADTLLSPSHSSSTAERLPFSDRSPFRGQVHIFHSLGRSSINVQS